MPTEDDDGLNWTSGVFDDDDFEDLMNKADNIISRQEKVFHFTLELSIEEALNVVRQWNQAINGNDFMFENFHSAIAGYVAFLDNALREMDIDPDDETD